MPDLDMSPYAAFVWPAWAITVVVLGAVVVRAMAASRKWTAELKRLEDDPDNRPEAVRDAAGHKVRPHVAQGAVGQEE